LPSHVHLAYPQPTGSHVLNAHAQQDAAVAKGLANRRQPISSHYAVTQD
jgi:hypothetical protein